MAASTDLARSNNEFFNKYAKDWKTGDKLINDTDEYQKRQTAYMDAWNAEQTPATTPAAPTPAPAPAGGAAPPPAAAAASPSAAMASLMEQQPPDPSMDVSLTGPNGLRQGLGIRNPPQYNYALASLGRGVY